MLGSHACISVSGAVGSSLPGRIKAKRDSGQTGKKTHCL